MPTEGGILSGLGECSHNNQTKHRQYELITSELNISYEDKLKIITNQSIKPISEKYRSI